MVNILIYKQRLISSLFMIEEKLSRMKLKWKKEICIEIASYVLPLSVCKMEKKSKLMRYLGE